MDLSSRRSFHSIRYSKKLQSIMTFEFCHQIVKKAIECSLDVVIGFCQRALPIGKPRKSSLSSFSFVLFKKALLMYNWVTLKQKRQQFLMQAPLPVLKPWMMSKTKKEDVSQVDRQLTNLDEEAGLEQRRATSCRNPPPIISSGFLSEIPMLSKPV